MVVFDSSVVAKDSEKAFVHLKVNLACKIDMCVLQICIFSAGDVVNILDFLHFLFHFFKFPRLINMLSL